MLDAPAQYVAFYTARLTDSGLVPGYARRLTPPYVEPAAWTASDGRIRFLSPGSPERGVAQDVRDDGSFVGAVVTEGSNGYPSPAIFDGASRRILPLPGQLGAADLAVGDTIIGSSFGADGSLNEIAVWRDEQFVGLVPNLPGVFRTPFDINLHGRYVGVYSDIGVYGGFVGEGLDAHELILPGFPLIRALGINDSNSIVGICLPDGNTRVGYIAHKDSEGDYTATKLLPLPGDLESPVWAINNNGDMVGLSTPAANGFPERATVYFAGSTTPVDMNTLIDPIAGVTLVRGIDINNHGQILVEGETPLGYRYYVLTPVPEPAALMACGTVAAVLARRRWRASGKSLY